MKIILDDQTLELTPTGSGKSYRALWGDTTVEVESLRAEAGKLEFMLNGQRLVAYVSSDGAQRWVTLNGQTRVLTRQTGARSRGGGSGHAAGELTAPMPGQVRAVNVREGEAVVKGQTLMVLEAMKMEIRIQAPQAGTVHKVLVQLGQTVERGQILVEVAA